MKVETILTPALFYQVENVEEKIVVVIDILRATSTITTILHNGATAVIPVKEETEAETYKANGFLVGGERGGETIPGFHFGNSPFDYAPELVAGNEVVLTTTNGTKCIEMAKMAHQVAIGSFLNLEALIKHLKNSQRDVVLFCAGWKDRINLEDSLFAGAVAASYPVRDCDDATLMARDAFELAKDNIFETLQNSNHFKRLASKGVTKDIAYCCEVNVLHIVPVLQEGKLVIA
ncbi:MAG: 2-phosphosulfolactate phosphatase [Bacteroidia bacterium]